jgi:cytochrome c
MRNSAITVLAIVAAACGAGAASAAGDPRRGAEIYTACEDCHSLDTNDVGPLHRGVVGRKAGSVPGYAYSPALRRANIVWTEANLDRWLADPVKFVPGTKMGFRLNRAQDREDVIAFLKSGAS